MSWLVVSHAVMRNPPNQCGRTQCAGQTSHKTGSARTPATATSSFLGMGSDTLGPSGERLPGHLRICGEKSIFEPVNCNSQHCIDKLGESFHKLLVNFSFM